MSRQQFWLPAGFTLILLGYFMVWLPGRVAGLSFIGLEMGEWVKFLPQVRNGEILPGRNLFYLPPITLAMLMSLTTVCWLPGRWQNWAMRGLAMLVSLLAFPSLDAIRYEPPAEWLLRLLLIGLAGLVALGSRWLRPGRVWLALWLAIGLTGAILPTWVYGAIRPVASNLFGYPIGFGPGLWLNLIGHLLLVTLTLKMKN